MMDRQAFGMFVGIMNEELARRDSMTQEQQGISDALQASLGDTSDSGKMSTAYLQNELDLTQRELAAENIFIGLLEARQQELRDQIDVDEAFVDAWAQTITELRTEWNRTHGAESPAPF